MPTFARLVAAVLLAVLGVFVAELAKPYFEDEVPLGLLTPVAAAAGVVVGWVFLGKKLQKIAGNTVALGLTAAVAQAVLVFFVFAVDLMLTRAFRMSYNSPMEAVVGVFEAAMEYFMVVAKPDVIVASLLGGVVVAFVTAWVARRTR